ncbi:MAG TPA: hypothetical protein VEX67_05040 [Solirubrobacteraceae bacterium]|nr:hypothetical protein [Solirubrobacteraceae bacterium]
MRRPSAALVLSSAALFVALGGPAAAQEAAREIAGARLVGNSVTGAKIRDGSLAAKDLSARARRTLKTPANRSVTAAKLRANAVGAAAIARGAVRQGELAAGAVGASKLAARAVGSTAVADGSLRARDLGRHQGHVQLDFGPIGPGACQVLPVGLSGAAADAIALVTPPANWPAAIQVTSLLGPGDRSVSVLACNFTGAPQDPGPVSFRYLVVEL